MKPGFVPGIVREIRVEITESMCAAFGGVMVHRCCSTWSVVHQMEIAARAVLVDFLEDHEEGIGAHVSVDHHAPCGVGKIMRVRAELIEVRHGCAVCAVSAHDEDRLLAEGKQVQVIKSKVDIEKLMRDA